jgi:Tol biopolymer transport system component/DNA-binding winged helix-turn-helix (wHTH) protein
MIEYSESPLRFGPFRVDLHTHELLKDSIKLRLVGQPFEILAMLLSRPGELVTREELRARLWPGDTFVDFDHGLNAAVNKLRETLCDSVENPRYVETLPRRGYRFIGKVERIGPALWLRDEEKKTAEQLPRQGNGLAQQSQPDEAPANKAERPAAGQGRPYLAAAAVLFTILLGGTFLLKTLSSRSKSAEANLQPPRIRAFTKASDTTGQPAFSADGNKMAFYRESASPEESGIYAQLVGSEQPLQLTKTNKDCCPAWSPDGDSIAFSRRMGEGTEIFIVSALGGPERRVDVSGANPKMGSVAWSHDGKGIVFSGDGGLFLAEPDKGVVRRLTVTTPARRDWGPTFSPDGTQLLFARSSDTGFPEELMTIRASGGEPTLIAAAPARLHGPAQWSSDGRSVIFAAERGGKSALWRVSTETREPPVQFNDGGSDPAVSPKGNRLAYERETRGLTIWEMDLPSHDRSESRVLVPLTSQTDQGPGPQFSPDGNKIAYMSDRSGTMEIWVSNRDGSNPVQVTAIGDAGTPRWSPDSQAIAFDVNRRNGVGVFVIRLQGGEPRLLTQDDFENRCPSWSRDGKWIYFASARTGAWQVWKIPAAGGTPVQLTKHGGHAAVESADGKYVYYAKTPYANPQIWQVPLNGGTESVVSPLVRPPSWASWTVVDQGILFAESSGQGAPVLNLFDPKSRRVKTVGALDIVPFWLSATRDGKTAAFDKPGWRQSQIMLVENFR